MLKLDMKRKIENESRGFMNSKNIVFIEGEIFFIY